MLGKQVLYKLSSNDAEVINRRRVNSIVTSDVTWPKEAQVHFGNEALEGQVYPGVIVREWSDTYNLQIFLDGNDIYWATSRNIGYEPGQFRLA